MGQRAEISTTQLNLPAILSVMAGVVVVTLDISLTSTAIPTNATGLEGNPASAIWIINLYYLAVVTSLLPLAALGEIYGHHRIFLGGLILFSIGALLSGAAGSLAALAMGRAVLGVRAAAVSATTPALIRAMYPPARLNCGLGLYATIVGIALAIGPPATSAVLSVVSWPWLYWQAVPLVLIAVALGKRWLPESERNIRRFNALSAILCAMAFSGLLFAIAGMAHLGGAAIFAALALFGVCLTLLLQRERRHPAPILGADLFRIPIFTLSSPTSILSFAVQGLVFVVLPFLFQFRLGFTQIEAGLLILPWPLTLICMTVIASCSAERIALGALGGIGLAILACGLVTVAVLPQGSDTTTIAWRLVLCGIGFGLFQSPNMIAIMRSAPGARSGSTGGILALSRLLGQPIGAALVAACLTLWHEAGIGVVLWVGVTLAMIGSGVSLLRLTPAIRNATGNL